MTRAPSQQNEPQREPDEPETAEQAAPTQEAVREEEPAAPAIIVDAERRAPMPQAITEAVLEVMAGVKKLAQNERNDHGGYTFASVDDFYEMVRPLMATAGLWVFPEEIATSFRATQSGQNTSTWLVVKFEFSFFHKSGVQWDHRPVRTIMANAAMGPQAFGAAASYADKFFLRALFRIATGELEIDHGVDGALPALSSRQAQGMGRDDNQFTRGPNQPRGQQRGGASGGGQKSPAQAKRDGDWDLMTKGMAIQRSEEELTAWGKAHERDLARLPREWKVQARELYVKELERVRALDEARARDLDRRDLNQPLDDQGEDDGLVSTASRWMMTRSLATAPPRSEPWPMTSR